LVGSKGDTPRIEINKTLILQGDARLRLSHVAPCLSSRYDKTYLILSARLFLPEFYLSIYLDQGEDGRARAEGGKRARGGRARDVATP